MKGRTVAYKYLQVVVVGVTVVVFGLAFVVAVVVDGSACVGFSVVVVVAVVVDFVVVVAGQSSFSGRHLLHSAL